MWTIIIAAVIIYWFVQMIIIDDFFWAAVITAGIIFFFVDVDIQKETIDLKTKTEIKRSIDDAHDIAIDAVEKAGEASVDIEQAFDKGKDKAKKPEQDMNKIDANSLNFPDPQYLDLSVRSDRPATFYKTDDGVIACLDNKKVDCFKSIVIRTHTDGTRYICNGVEVCYGAQ
jgi:hypothetical protein